jgi:hypothetical protein
MSLGMSIATNYSAGSGTERNYMTVHTEQARMRAQLASARLTLEQTDDDATFARALATEARCLRELEALREGPEGGFPGQSEDA